MPTRSHALRVFALFVLVLTGRLVAQDDRRTLRVFIFAGQSNMVGSDSKVKDIERFPPFSGLDQPQTKVLFNYCLGREDKRESKGWEPLAPVNGIVGPELSFAKRVTDHIKVPIAIIKCAAGGTHLGGDWNPDEPQGFKMYPLALQRIRDALADLDRRKVRYRLEGFLWHQGENDMFEDDFRANYGRNLKRFLDCWRRDLAAPELRFYIGELCTKTVWGMDNRSRMHAISLGQKEVCDADPFAQYIPTSHVAVEIGNDTGLHYHYGTLGQLEHGFNYADAYLGTIGKLPGVERPLKKWPYAGGARVQLFVLAGHRNMEGERAFVGDLKTIRRAARLARDDHRIAFRYDLGGVLASKAWEPLGPAGFYETFGPELSFGSRLATKLRSPVAIAKFTHSGSQIIDWTPEGSEAENRSLHQRFVAFVSDAVRDLEAKGHEVDLEGVFYHLSENDMAYLPYRR
ncbi:MAG: hypothetical protein KDB53_04630, partial [Planctomycetes bacterium]|nr:hypothetical protein [Planctomycetota bacterium]